MTEPQPQQPRRDIVEVLVERMLNALMSSREPFTTSELFSAVMTLAKRSVIVVGRLGVTDEHKRLNQESALRSIMDLFPEETKQ